MLVTGGAVITEVVPDGDTVWWAESRPGEGGRVAIMRWFDGTAQEITPPEANVRTTVHEYGGGSWWAQNGTLWYVDHSDQRLRALTPGCEPLILSAEPPEPRAWRYADFRPTPDGHWLIGVAERHAIGADSDVPCQPENLIIAIASDGSGCSVDLASGSDFYGSPCLSPEGKALAWVQWEHPNMPWDDSSLKLATLQSSKGSIAISQVQHVAGGQDESIVEPAWSPDGTLHYLSDRSDLWQLYALGQSTPVFTADGEIGYPPWVHGLSRYGFDETGQVLAASFKGGIDHLPGFPEDTSFYSIRFSGNKLAFASASWSRELAVHFDGKIVSDPKPLPLSDGYLQAPEVISFPTGSDGSDEAHALYYAPANPEYSAPDNEKPPLIVLAHGGPTSAARSQISLAQRFWTSRGFAVVDVNYRGSSGFGRRYRQKLNGEWGIADVEDCVAVARFLVDRGDVDVQRLIIRGGSAGGFTVLSALAFHDLFTAGTSLYGVADLEALANDTHKFESRYLDNLIGSWPEDADIYAQRSPINHLDGFTAPMIVMQGSDDKIVPPNQSRMIVDALDARKLPVAYLEFAGEQHGFRQAATITTAIRSELSFYGRVFGFTPDGETVPVDIRNL
ncbi:Dipeptidyl aminopeptidase BIII [Granulosicoccus antarcticus IMCC3135]|uniref:Dipeptidyl aminopeptidase BIII n=2 Tax=Granulosicoccus TaxID=437504 RepID=A0A2Z2NNH9_9GAMM|nr:Dipeptidyl aminopeptidase BIII [Granulosicoccus antarcticus IMCC3135]